jgi:Protein of unknown function (DUF3363)
MKLCSHLPIERQLRASGATWLDQQLVQGAPGIGRQGFGLDVRHALTERESFLVKQGLGERSGQRVILARQLLETLQRRELDATAKSISSTTGLSYREATDGALITGTYRQSFTLTSGRFAMLDDGIGFSLVPWRPVLEKRLGQTISAVIHRDHIDWRLRFSVVSGVARRSKCIADTAGCLAQR